MSNVEIFDTTFAITILVIMALCIPTALLLANWFLHPGKIKQVLIKGSAYECGLAHVSGTANERYPVKYYMVAMLFLVFDLEVAFLYPWTVQFLTGGWELLFVLRAISTCTRRACWIGPALKIKRVFYLK